MVDKNMCISLCESRIARLKDLIKHNGNPSQASLYYVEGQRAYTLGYITAMCEAGIFDTKLGNKLLDELDAVTHGK